MLVFRVHLRNLLASIFSPTCRTGVGCTRSNFGQVAQTIATHELSHTSAFIQQMWCEETNDNKSTEKAEALALTDILSRIRRQGLQFHQCKRWEKTLPLFSADIQKKLTKKLKKTWEDFGTKCTFKKKFSKKNRCFMEEENFPSQTHRGKMFFF